MCQMDSEHYEHLDDIIDEFTELATEKYEKGQLEHGGKLWKKSGLLDMAIDEAIDQVIYLITLKQQIEKRNY